VKPALYVINQKVISHTMFNPRPKAKDLPGYVPKEKKQKPIRKVSEKKSIKNEVEGGMLLFFIKVWNSRLPGDQFEKREYSSVEEWRDHTSKYRVDCVTYEPIKHMMPGCFMHVLTKNHTEWTKNPRNICMGSFDTHQVQEFEPKSKLVERGPGGFWFNEYKEELKAEYARTV